MTKTYTFDLDIISDLHKDAYGFRPSESFWGFLAAANADQKQAVWDDLVNAADAAADREHEEQAEAIVRFERTIYDLRNSGAKDLNMAIRWLHDAHDTRGDDEFLEFHLGIPYGYIARSRSFQQLAREEQTVEDSWAEDFDVLGYTA